MVIHPFAAMSFHADRQMKMLIATFCNFETMSKRRITKAVKTTKQVTGCAQVTKCSTTDHQLQYS